MTLSIGIDDPHDPAASALLSASHALMQGLFPAESNHYLSVDDLCQPDILFFTARLGGEIKGCCALKVFHAYGEIKSMFVHPPARGHGIAQRLLGHIETEARMLALPCLRLETGVLLQEAHRLYRRDGFREIGPFGNYDPDPNSLFMEKTL